MSQLLKKVIDLNWILPTQPFKLIFGCQALVTLKLFNPIINWAWPFSQYFTPSILSQREYDSCNIITLLSWSNKAQNVKSCDCHLPLWSCKSKEWIYPLWIWLICLQCWSGHAFAMGEESKTTKSRMWIWPWFALKGVRCETFKSQRINPVWSVVGNKNKDWDW